MVNLAKSFLSLHFFILNLTYQHYSLKTPKICVLVPVSTFQVEPMAFLMLKIDRGDMKRFLAVLVTATILAPFAANSAVVGDINSDGKIISLRQFFLYRYLLV